MLTSHVDLGQLITASLIAIVGWFIKKEIVTFGKRLDKHEDVILTMTNKLSVVVGQVGIIAQLYNPERHIRKTDG